MLGKAYQYKWLDFTDQVQSALLESQGYCYVLQNIDKNVPLRTDTFDNANYHGGYTSATLAGGRLFTFVGKVCALTKEKRGQAWRILMNKLQPEPNPNVLSRWFYDLTWTDDDGSLRTVKAKVFNHPQPSNGVIDPENTVIDFVFELYAETEKVYDPVVNTETGGIGTHGGMTLPTPIPDYLSWFAGYIECENEGNRDAPLKVQVVWSVINPKIINITNQQSYRLGTPTNPYTSTNLVYDNRNLNNVITERLVVTDNNVDVKKERSSWSDIYLSPWVNYIIVLGTGTANVTVTRRDTYFY